MSIEIKNILEELNIGIDNAIVLNFHENMLPALFESGMSETEALLHLVKDLNRQHYKLKIEYLKEFNNNKGNTSND